MVLASLRALGGPRPEAAALALASVFDSLVLRELAGAIHDWLGRRPGR